MNTILCPHCHAPVERNELEQAASQATHYLICPVCDAPFPMVSLSRDSQHVSDGDAILDA